MKIKGTPNDVDLNRVAVIIPIFNVGKYLRQCIISVMRQTFHTFTIFAVNDGSQDDSENIIKQLAEEDSRIFLINKPNGGVSSARNIALDQVQKIGGYRFIYFLDADDYINEKLLETFVDALTSTNSDYAVCAYEKVSLRLSKRNSQCLKCDKGFELMSKQDIAEHFFQTRKKNETNRNADRTVSLFLNNRFFRSDKILDLRFNTDLRVCEDQDFMIRAMERLQSGVEIYDCLFYYRRRVSSLSNSDNVKKMDLLVYENYLTADNDYPIYIRKGILSNYLHHLIQHLYTVLASNETIAKKKKEYMNAVRLIEQSEFSDTDYVKRQSKVLSKGFLFTIFYSKLRLLTKSLTVFGRNIRFYK